MPYSPVGIVNIFVAELRGRDEEVAAHGAILVGKSLDLVVAVFLAYHFPKDFGTHAEVGIRIDKIFRIEPIIAGYFIFHIVEGPHITLLVAMIGLEDNMIFGIIRGIDHIDFRCVRLVAIHIKVAEIVGIHVSVI